MPKQHKSLFHTMTQAQFTNAVRQLDEEIPSLNRDQIIVGLARIVAMVRDGHTSLSPYYNPSLAFTYIHFMFTGSRMVFSYALPIPPTPRSPVAGFCASED